jgi:hypothetical protein
MHIKTVVLLGALGSILAFAVQAQAPVLKGSDVTEDALVDALAIEGPAAPGGATRGFRPAKPATDARPNKPAPGKASLLITFPTDSAELTPETPWTPWRVPCSPTLWPASPSRSKAMPMRAAMPSAT